MKTSTNSGYVVVAVILFATSLACANYTVYCYFAADFPSAPNHTSAMTRGNEYFAITLMLLICLGWALRQLFKKQQRR